MSIKSIKEKQLLVNLAKSFGQEIDPKLVNEVEKHKQVETNIRESIRSNVLNDLTKALLELKQEADRVSQENNYPLPPSLDDIEHLIEYEEKANDLVQNSQETDTTETIADAVPDTESNSHTLQELAAEALSNLSKADSFQQPDPTLVDSDINSIRKKIKFLEQWISKVSMAGPGGGETKLRFLDDVDRDSIVNGYVLSYDEITNKFTFVSPTAGSFTPTDVKQVFAEVKNAESFPITIGQPVYLFAATGNRASVKLANNTGDPTSAKTLGLVYSASISPGGTGLVITQGVVTGVDTQAYSEGTTLYLGNTAGSLTAVKPYAPEHLVYIGVVERANQGQGQIYVKPQNGYELNEIHDVSINNTVPLSNNDIIVWNSASNIWVNRPISYLNQTTANIIENSNLYYTNARVYANVIGLLDVKVNVSDLSNANVATATKLTTARTINNTSFDGTANITITANAETLTGTTLKSTIVSSNLTSVGVLSTLDVANNITIGDSILCSGTTGGLFPIGVTNIVIGSPGGNTNIRNNLILGSGQTLSTSGTVTANATTAFKAGSAAESGVALEIPREGGIRNMYNGDNTMYFDVSNGGSSHGHFSFRGSNAFTQYAKIDNNGIDAITSYKGKTSFNVALDTEFTVDNLKFRISNQGGVFPQVGNASGTNVDLCWSAMAVVSGGSVSSQNSGVIISAGSWSSIYTAHGLDTRGDTIVAHITDKNSGKIYRVTYLVTNNSSNTTGYNILVERII